MLPKFYQQSYSHLGEVLLILQKQVRAKDLDLDALRISFDQVQQVFEQEIMALTLEDLDSSAIALQQSAKTEIHRMLRLLGTDLLFLQSSRQAGTTQQRLQKISDRLEQLISYCQGLLEITV
ncbi:heterocyst frequency control protein PatD [Crocosphaera sp. XPORK-15E]|uniref:heterocyst frequency control protein PatD n=1 Tax=Crocosphaera sp. XPORK-15E TaxID=3110247 RepID=UPI002B1F6F6B|nr:heterocyst frequency control protein PatD [Crocosphaera sp. XPORK-15E]MEA5535699.1 heterocyst frequency control protein PatD [Crocosphaera sp. XPORK-15E]